MLSKLSVTLVYAEPQQQWVYEARVARGTEAWELIQASHFLEQVPALNNRTIETLELAVYAQKINADHLLQEGDRVEIIRPLRADPKVVRREMAKLGKTIGKQRNE